MPIPDQITIRIEGDSGDGIITMGLIAARTAARMGLHVLTYSTFLAVVRGGQSTFQLRLGRKPLLSHGDAPDVLVALNKQAVIDNGQQVTPAGLAIHPLADSEVGDKITAHAFKLSLNFEEIAIEETGVARCKNIVAVGALINLLGLDVEIALAATRDNFQHKDPEMVDLNLRALKAGWEALNAHKANLPACVIVPEDNTSRMLLSGNEAIALGALVAGVRFFAGYPITPASEIMEWLACNLPRVGGRMIQAEDEIAALAMCIGASYGGTKSMTATSGPGLSLMSELIGLAGMMETPVVIVDVQRAGPSTGMPTKEGQGDLNLATHGVHGEVPRVVLAPKSVIGCFEQTIQAVNTAHKFHIPVLLLSSQSLSHRMQTITPPDMASMQIDDEVMFDGKLAEGQVYERFRPMPDGMPSARSIPGIPNGMYRAGGLEHDEVGNPNFEPDVRQRMVDRRRERMKAIQREFSSADGDDCSCEPGATIGVISWGATASVTHEAINRMRAEGWKISFFFPSVIWPMPDDSIERFLASGLRQLFVCELNATRQFGKMIRARYTTNLVEHDIRVCGITQDIGLPFTAAQIRNYIMEYVADDLSRTGILPFSSTTIRDRIFGPAEIMKPVETGA